MWHPRENPRHRLPSQALRSIATPFLRLEVVAQGTPSFLLHYHVVTDPARPPSQKCLEFNRPSRPNPPDSDARLRPIQTRVRLLKVWAAGEGF
jgi:hypothetical protein